MWETGGRISDILNLKWADINFNKKLVTIQPFSNSDKLI
ncbi:MAG: site-specific integrase [Methanosarcinales archaeon]|nr:site-specific integrase [Methanosarcinales archaeon]